MKNILLFGSLGLMLLFTACKKQGCTDDLASNFDSEAEKDDGSCEYSTDMIFYLNSARETYYNDKPDFYAPFHLYVDGAKIGEISVSSANFQTYETAPACGSTGGGTLNYTHTWGNKEGNVVVTIKDQLDNSHGTISVNVDKLFSSDNSCEGVLL